MDGAGPFGERVQNNREIAAGRARLQVTGLNEVKHMIRVLVVDDHHLVRTGTMRLLDDVDGIEIFGEAESGEEAIEKVRQLEPEVVLMDVQIPGIGSLEATRRCLSVDPDVWIIAVIVYEDEPYPSKLLNVGAAGYLTKRANVDEMVRAIKRVCVCRSALHQFGDRTAARVASLHARVGKSLRDLVQPGDANCAHGDWRASGRRDQ